MSVQSAHRCGTAAIVGRPNVGKSTLLNRFLGQKIAIVSPKPETTRDRLLGILTLPAAQIMFLDTPGIYRGAKTLLGKHQVQQAQEALQEGDLILLMTEAQAGVTDGEREIIRLLPREKQGQTAPVFLAINKVDRVERGLILPQIEEMTRLYPFREIFPISATKGDNLEPLLKALTAALPEGPALYPPDQVTDRPVRDLARELIREKALLFTHEEIPHAVAVEMEEWRPGRPGREQAAGGLPSTYLRATLFVERETQKGILIGKEGALLKRIGRAARKEIEDLIEGPAYLDLWVKVQRNWRKDPAVLKRLGYG
ncbi:MAG: GTPase Era [Candidatus Omnitrophica bacterium]|nr:GTPase Era [Candidatus Omnitrophota bacterium]